MSKRRQGKAKGGRSARHHEPQGFYLPPEPKRRVSASGRDLLADGQAGVAEYFTRKARREEMAALGFVEERLSPEEMLAAVQGSETPTVQARDMEPRDPAFPPGDTPAVGVSQ